ncbi:hypothetical protein MLD38_007031 [Melastoma candidum]|uniref:Uncharacterized protein n=1 Tax=Melastoma candidum TaxID=119954 RepID=A0ACB9RPH9_9MYRT|nr:hypothetical protein MLD38_007031 [Melastoma candidum]
MLLLLYVDDILFVGSDQRLMDRTVASLSEQFAMKDFGFPSTFLNVQIRRTSTGLFLSQEHYARRLIQHHGMENSNPTKTPLSPKFYPSAEGESLADPMPFRALIGSLQYLTLTRPDITYSVNQLSQFIQCPTVVHLQARRILRYLNGSAALGLPLKATDTTRLVTFADADWAACPTTRRSTTGYAVYLGSTLISWRSKKQPTVACSSTEAEYRAMAYAVAETNWLSSLARELHISLSRPLLVCCDNLGATYLAANPIQHNRTKHMDIDYHFVREQVQTGDVLIKYVPTKDQRADILTKNLGCASFAAQRSNLTLRYEHELAAA